ncbi:MAG: hypothetical protein U1E59_18335 [Amaricoccus sp.]
MAGLGEDVEKRDRVGGDDQVGTSMTASHGVPGWAAGGRGMAERALQLAPHLGRRVCSIPR